MLIGFFAQGEGPHLAIAKHLIDSAKQVMPKVDVWHLTDGKTPAMGRCIRIVEPMPMGIRRLEHYARLTGDWCFVDSDVVFRKDVRDVFDKPFDVALASREGTIWADGEYARVNPYNFGVVFSRCPRFWQTVIKGVESLPGGMHDWGGEQFVTCELAKRRDFKVEILPSSYNFTPAKREDSLEHVHIAHYKGPRKAWITMPP